MPYTLSMRGDLSSHNKAHRRMAKGFCAIWMLLDLCKTSWHLKMLAGDLP